MFRKGFTTPPPPLGHLKVKPPIEGTNKIGGCALQPTFFDIVPFPRPGRAGATFFAWKVKKWISKT
jgi:hypothetical protein